jgi:ribosomal protein S18 acetylase RimI-like enzyme
LTLVAVADAGVVGFVEGSQLTEGLGWIRNLYVVPPARRSGTARALIEALARRFEELGLSHIGLKVGSSNEVAREAYARLGFEEFERSFAVGIEQLLRG